MPYSLLDEILSLRKSAGSIFDGSIAKERLSDKYASISEHATEAANTGAMGNKLTPSSAMTSSAPEFGLERNKIQQSISLDKAPRQQLDEISEEKSEIASPPKPGVSKSEALTSDGNGLVWMGLGAGVVFLFIVAIVRMFDFMPDAEITDKRAIVEVVEKDSAKVETHNLDGSDTYDLEENFEKEYAQTISDVGTEKKLMWMMKLL